MAPWPGWADAYGKAYAAAAAFLFGSTDPDRKVTIVHIDSKRRVSPGSWDRDTAVKLRIGGASVAPRRVPPFETSRSSRYTGYGPTALALALVLATPIPWRRRAWALPWAALLASVFVATMLAIWIYGWFYGEECLSLAPFSEEHAARAKLVATVLDMNSWMGPYYIAPVFIWVLVSFRREDLESFFATLSIPQQPPGS
jgi:hypothetical protein